MPYVAAELASVSEVVELLRREYQKYACGAPRAHGADVDDEPALRHDRHYTALRLAPLARKRAAVIRLRYERRIDDIVLRQVQRRLDIEDVRLSQREPLDQPWSLLPTRARRKLIGCHIAHLISHQTATEVSDFPEEPGR